MTIRCRNHSTCLRKPLILKSSQLTAGVCLLVTAGAQRHRRAAARATCICPTAHMDYKAFIVRDAAPHVIFRNYFFIALSVTVEIMIYCKQDGKVSGACQTTKDLDQLNGCREVMAKLCHLTLCQDASILFAAESEKLG